MHPISLALQGSIAYVLIAEIVVVAVLFLATLWIMVRRMRLQTATASVDGAVATSHAHIAVEETPEYRELNAKFQSLAAELENHPEKDSEALQNKVKFLESKLLEYEILQEEIGALSQLKADNEKLKSELVKLGGNPSAVAAPAQPAATATPDPTPPIVAAPAPPLEPAPIAVAPPPAVPPSSPVIEEGGDAQAKIDQLFADFAKTEASPETTPSTPAPVAAAAPIVPPAAMPPSVVEPTDLDALLKDIDALAADKTDPPKA